MIDIYSLLEVTARGGGGGSGGGSGGGGGGSLIVLAGYLPAYHLNSQLYKRLGSMWVAVVGLPLGLTWGIGLWVVVGGFIGFLMFAGAIFGVYSGYKGLHARVLKRAKKTKVTIGKAASLDPAWDAKMLEERVSQIFYAYQHDWAQFQTERIATYTTPSYARHNWLMLTALHQLSRQNVMQDVKLKKITFVEANDSVENNQDSFTAYISAQATDQLIDTRDNTILYTDKKPFEEYWNFVRDEQRGWVLSGINQVTEKYTARSEAVGSFARASGMFFSLDWGWLLLPKFGNVFSKANFKKSDVNNHCIGLLGQELVQLYTYVPAKDQKENVATEFIVAQIAVPGKNYGRIVAEHKEPWYKGSIFKRKPKGLNKLQVESMDINNRFNLYADNVEQATTFELLHPLYMEKVIATPGTFNIEVYDNTIFIYSKDKKASYTDLFNLLLDAHKALVR